MTAEERTRSYLFVMVLLVFFVLLHWLQALMGIQAMSFDAPHLVKAISVLYAVVNICVCVTQVYLGFRATRFYLCAPYPRTQRKDNGFSATHALIMVAVTLGGQIIFLAPYVYYHG